MTWIMAGKTSGDVTVTRLLYGVLFSRQRSLIPTEVAAKISLRAMSRRLPPDRTNKRQATDCPHLKARHSRVRTTVGHSSKRTAEATSFKKVARECHSTRLCRFRRTCSFAITSRTGRRLRARCARVPRSRSILRASSRQTSPSYLTDLTEWPICSINSFVSPTVTSSSLLLLLRTARKTPSPSSRRLARTS